MRMRGNHLFLLGGGGSRGPPPNPPPNAELEDDDEEAEVILRPPPPGSLMANVSPSFNEKSFFGPAGRCGEGPSSMSAPPSSVEGFAARFAAAF